MSSLKNCYQYPRPALTVDTVIVAGKKDNPAESKILLIKRLNPPFKDSWALPGGFVDENEGLDAAAKRELLEETSVDASSITFTQVGAFGDPGRDPRGWTVTVAYAALVPSTELGVKAADDAREACWFPLHELIPPSSPAYSCSASNSESETSSTTLHLPLAFDHTIVVAKSLVALADAEGTRRRITMAEEGKSQAMSELPGDANALDNYFRFVAEQMKG
eukprot:CAMPEP_0175042352 /NCGR_PEP_ID=MMETSP0052_2-20121109/2511_1 /TAXON_ID=51329 ORGANISM="Polytomella parva, Strain SAG 63-3" /NCGR_SAMPLE_ID=MMETSP0052_2 /ASSEMBLY_ACC=CAM_ASM_000194 /LENGTH=219 /DNA_ID=CAMNT_0016305145 /DNA_START=132 /DNA_END=791 /DNA_ORIENTATION=-